MFYFFWALIINSAILLGASFIRAIQAKALWIWLGATTLAYVCYELVPRPAHETMRLDRLILWPLLLVVVIRCIIRSNVSR